MSREPQRESERRDRIWYPEPDTDFSDFSGATPPSKLMFSLTGRCNLRCAHCARGIYEVQAQETPTGLVDHVIEHLLPKLRAVRLGGTDLGEQLISRHFDRFAEAVARYPEVELEIVSNLSVLTAPRAELIARACREFAISMEGVGEFFEATRGFPWERFRSNLGLLSEARRRVPGSQLRILALVTCYYDNLDQLERLLELRDEGIDLFRFRLFRPNDSEQEAQALEHHRALANRAFASLRAKAAALGVQVDTPPEFPIRTLREISLERRAKGGARDEAGAATAEAGERWICHFPFEVASVFPDGRVSPCCEDIFLGQLDGENPDFSTLFAGPDWVELRRQVATGDFRGRCAACEFRRSREGRP